jgi:hypothetical protein
MSRAGRAHDARRTGSRHRAARLRFGWTRLWSGPSLNHHVIPAKAGISVLGVPPVATQSGLGELKRNRDSRLRGNDPGGMEGNDAAGRGMIPPERRGMTRWESGE